jgi:hypothetical protein
MSMTRASRQLGPATVPLERGNSGASSPPGAEVTVDGRNRMGDS